MKDVDIVSAATGFTSVTSRQYILVFHEALYMPELDHNLINPKKLRQFYTQVQDNPWIGPSQDVPFALILWYVAKTIYFS